MINHGKICFVVPSLHLGGQENAISILANYCASEKLDVTLITLYNFPHFYKVDDDITIIDPPYDKSKGNKLWYYIRIIAFLRRNIKSISAERIVSFGDWSNILIIMACIGLKTKVYISDRASPDLVFRRYVRFLRKILYPKAYGIIAQTARAAQQKYKMLGNEINIKVIPNPVKPIQLYPGTKRKNYILGVGRHWHVKGLDRLLEAFALINRYDYKLMIAGSNGPVTEKFGKIVEKYGLKSTVTFLDSVNEIDKLYAECKIFVLPSRSEGFPNALIESMAAGLACISFDCSAGPSEIITHGKDGILVEEGNVPELARQIQYLIDNDEEIDRLGNNALKIRERLSLEKIGRQYVEFIMNS